ncbi:MAG: hypothetical protein ACTSRU_00820 [Candidatus Hodarchaeales archaeon]
MEIITQEHVIARISAKRFNNLLEFLGNISHYVVAIVYSEEGVTLVIQQKGWMRIEFDFDEGYTKSGYGLITLKNNSNKIDLSEITVKITAVCDDFELIASYDGYHILVKKECLQRVSDLFQ